MKNRRVYLPLFWVLAASFCSQHPLGHSTKMASGLDPVGR